ncbi:MAG: hypothetical protein ACRBFS_20095 [Aureispira sp.]
MLQLFRNNQIFTVIFVLIYALVFSVNTWLYEGISLASFEQLPSTIGAWLVDWVDSPMTNRLTFIVLLLVQAFIVNLLINHFRLAKQHSYVPAVTYILVHFAGVGIDICSPVMLANSFMLWAFYSLLCSYEKRVSLATIFNVGFATAMAALCYYGFIVYGLWIMLALFLLRSFDPQEFIILLGGFFVPFFLIGTYHFVNSNLGNWFHTEIWAHYQQMTVHYDTTIGLYILIGFFVTPVILALLQLQTLHFKTTSKEKKYITMVLWMPLIGVFSFLFQSDLYAYHFLVLALPISILLSLVLQSFKSLALAELFHLVLFMLALGVQYQQFFFYST